MSTFFSANALVSQRASGYKNTAYALAELIDNAFDAEAKAVKVLFLEKKDAQNRRYVDEILVCDDGYGMSETEVQECLQFGNTTHTDLEEIVAKKTKGKFGYGLPNASLSQCPCVHVFSWRSPSKIFSTYLDLKELKERNTIEIPQVKKVALPLYYKGLGATLDEGHGAIVSWRSCDRLSNSRASTIFDKSEELLGRLYRYLLTGGRQIALEAYEHNGRTQTYTQTERRALRPNDPLFLMSDTYIARFLERESKRDPGIEDPQRDPATHLGPFSNSVEKCNPTNECIEGHRYPFAFNWAGRNYRFDITTSVAQLPVQKPGIKIGAHTEVGQFYGRKDSISFVRADREISSGNYGFYKETEPQNRWWTVEVRFSPDSDDLLGVHNNKQGIEFVNTRDMDPTEQFDPYTASLQQAREKLWVEMSKKIQRAKDEAWKIVRERDKQWSLQHVDDDAEGASAIPGATAKTVTTQKHVDGTRSTKFSADQRHALFQRLREKYPVIDDQDIERSIERFDTSFVRGCVLYCPSESESLWSHSTVYDFLIILINTNHGFYSNVIEPFRTSQAESALAAMELFISSLAWEEHNHFGHEREKDVIERFRSLVGIHLHRYIREVQVSESEARTFYEVETESN